MAIQVKWMHDTLVLREAQFAMGVNNALRSVSDRLERMDRMRELGQHEAGRRLLLRLDTLRALDDHEAAMDIGAGQERFRLEPTEQGSRMEFEFDHERERNDRTTNEFDPSGQEELVADLVRTILAKEQRRNIHDRLSPGLLDSLLVQELHANDIDVKWTRAIYSVDNELVLLPENPEASSTVLLNTQYRERLYRHDISGPAFYLHVAIPDQGSSIYKSILPLIISSALFIGVLMMAFFYSIRTILRQKRLNDIRNDLVNNLTHELKTPISTIGLACEALTDPSMPKTDQQVRTFVTMIRDENKRLGSLVENVLQSAVMDGGLMVLKLVDLDIHELVKDVMNSSNIQVSRRNGRMELDLQAEIHHVQGDRIHLTNLFYNLIDNAVKYTEKEPRVRISSRSNDVGITISVSDNGIGIASGEQKKIFDRLYRVPTGNLHNAKGFGLGLSYVRTVVLRHNGTINVESTPGTGSTFRIFLPFEHVRKDQASVGRR